MPIRHHYSGCCNEETASRLAAYLDGNDCRQRCLDHLFSCELRASRARFNVRQGIFGDKWISTHEFANLLELHIPCRLSDNPVDLLCAVVQVYPAEWSTCNC